MMTACEPLHYQIEQAYNLNPKVGQPHELRTKSCMLNKDLAMCFVAGSKFQKRQDEV